MSPLDQIAADFARAQAQFARSLADARAWQDDQRLQLDRSRIDPLNQAASTFNADLRQATDAVARAERLLAK